MRSPTIPVTHAALPVSWYRRSPANRAHVVNYDLAQLSLVLSLEKEAADRSCDVVGFSVNKTLKGEYCTLARMAPAQPPIRVS